MRDEPPCLDVSARPHAPDGPVGRRDASRPQDPCYSRNRTAASDPDPAAVQSAAGPRWSMTELRARVKSVATGLRALGVQRDDVVTVVSTVRPEMLEAWLAIIEVGATFNPVSSRSTAAEVADVIARTRTTTVIVDARAAATLRASLDAALFVPKVVGLDVQADDDGPILGFDALRLETVESSPHSPSEDA